MAAEFENNILIVKNPVDNSELSRFTITDETSFSSIASKCESYDKWASLPVKKRCFYITLLRKAIVKNQSELEKILKNETGKKNFDVFLEIFTVLEHLKQMPKIAKKALKPSFRNAGIMKSKKAYVLYEPLGVCGVISPWNYPLATPVGSAVQALLSGNNVILKPSEHTPLSSLFIKKLWDEYVGFSDAFNVVLGGGEVGKMIVDSDKVDAICFTGSTKIGKLIAKQCAEDLKPVILELGGKDPLVVLKDADKQRVVEAILFGGLSNAGQTCISVEEVYIEGDVFDFYVEKLSNRIKKMSSGDSSAMDLGSMIMKENCMKVKEHIDEIEDRGSVVCGKGISNEMFIAPTLIIDPPDSARVVNEETFGPVISLRKFTNEKDLVKMIHKTGYGLAGSIFGKNKKRIQRILRQLKIGNVSINDVITHYGIASLPFGGERLSGSGRLHGKEGVRSLCRTKSVVENRFSFLSDPWWYSRNKNIEKILKKVSKILYK